MKTTVGRPSLKWYGGGWQRAVWTIEHFPAHDAYLEPCFGAGSVLLRKPRAKLETANDVDGRVVNYFRELREHPDDLIELINLTPWAEAEFRTCLAPADDPLEDARRFFFTCWASIQGGPAPGPSDFRWQKKVTRRSAATKDVIGLDHLRQAAERLKHVQILERNALALIDRFHNTPALIYFDPPYLQETRSRSDGYAHEVTPAWHREAARLLRRHPGPVVVAGYRSALYEEIYEGYGWKRVEKEQGTNSGGRRVECLWLSPLATTKSTHG